MNSIIICTIITFCVVYVWDFANFPNEFASMVMELITHGKIKSIILRKPFGCSRCMSFWLCLIYLCIFNWKLIPVAFVMSYMSSYAFMLLQTFDMLMEKIFGWIQSKL